MDFSVCYNYILWRIESYCVAFQYYSIRHGIDAYKLGMLVGVKTSMIMQIWFTDLKRTAHNLTICWPKLAGLILSQRNYKLHKV